MTAGKGPLHKKINPRYLPIFATEEDRSMLINLWHQEDHEKLLLLCRDLGIADGPERFYRLSLTLARKSFAGFQQSIPRSKWNDITRGYLVVEIESLTAGGLPATKAATQLAKRPEWKAFLKSTTNGAEGLRVQYQAFKGAPFAKVMRKAYLFHVHCETMHEWHENLLEALRNPHPPVYL